MNKIKKESSYGILTIVSIVAIVAIFSLLSNLSVVTTTESPLEKENLAGEAFQKNIKKQQTQGLCMAEEFISGLMDLLSDNPSAKEIMFLIEKTNCQKVLGDSTLEDLIKVLKTSDMSKIK